MANKESDQRLTDKQLADATKALEVLFASEYINKKKLYWANFLRGLFFSAGSIVGAAVILTFLLWLLSLPQRLPLLGPVSQNIRSTIQHQTEK